MLTTVTEPRFYTHETTTRALRALAVKGGVSFCAVDLDAFVRGECGPPECGLLVVHAAHVKIARTSIAGLRRRLPHARIVTLGSDSIYYTRRYPDAHQGLLVDPRGFEYVRPEDVDLHLDLMQEVVDVYRRNGWPAERWLWSISGGTLAEAEEAARLAAPEPAVDCVCYANPRVSAPGGYRPRLTAELRARGKSVQWGGTTEFTTLDRAVLRGIYALYRTARVCLGTSSPSWTPCRTMKGWRDWLGPPLGLPLVYDDIPEMSQTEGPALLGAPPVPLFGYEDFDGLARLLDGLQDRQTRAELARVQTDWLRLHTLEMQFTRVLGAHGLWPL